MLSQFKVVQFERCIRPFVDQVIGAEREAAHGERTSLGVQRELPEIHIAASVDGEPLGVSYLATGSYPDESVGDGDLVEVGVVAVEEVSVWTPDLLQELPVHGKLLHVGHVELDPMVDPELPEPFGDQDYCKNRLGGIYLIFWFVRNGFDT